MMLNAALVLVLVFTSSATSQTICGDYQTNLVEYVAGNGNTMYKLVTIRIIHLTTPSDLVKPATVADNRMVPSTACAFGKMFAAAKLAGLRITITTGFRSLVRQQYLFDCWKAGTCPNGPIETSPGSSIFGRGNVLEFNVNCSNQPGAGSKCDDSPVYQWLLKNASGFGFARKVPSEPGIWEYQGPEL